MTIFDERQIAEETYHALGGSHSPIREPVRANLGNPLTGEIYVSAEEREYPGQVWLHEPGANFPLPDSADTDREDSPPALFTGLLKKETFQAGLVKYGRTVWVNTVNGVLTVLGGDGLYDESYLEGVPAQQRTAVERADFDWTLLRPTDPPSMQVTLSGGVVIIDGIPYNVTTQVSGDLTSYLSDVGPGEAKALMFTIDPTGPSIVIDAGSVFTDTSRDAGTGISDHSAVFANYPNSIPADESLWGWVKLYAGMTQIVSEDILPALEPGKGTLGGTISTLASLTDVSDSATPTQNYVVVGNSGGTAYETRLLNLPNLGDVSDSLAPTVNTFLKANGTLWSQDTIQSSDLPAISLQSLSNVTITTPADGQVLTYDDGTGEWVNEAAAGGSGGAIDSGVRVSGAENPLTGDDTMTDGSGSTLDFTTEDFDTDGYADLGTDPDFITASSDGFYQVVVNVAITASSGTPNGPVLITVGGSSALGAGGTIHMTADSLGTTRRQSVVAIGNIDNTETVNVALSNECGETVSFTVSMTLIRLGDQL